MSRWYEWVFAAVVLATPVWLFCVGPAVDSYCGARDGLADAQTDLAEGHLKLHIGGKWTPTSRAAAKIADEDYGIELINMGCIPTDYKTEYSRAYDEVVQRELDRRSMNVSIETIWQVAEKTVDADPK